MSGSVYLAGSEDVSRAGHNMSSAANEMMRAANQIEDTFQRYSRFMEDWLQRFEQVVENMGKITVDKG